MNSELINALISQIGNIVGIPLAAVLAVWQVKKGFTSKRNDEVNEKSFGLCCELFDLVSRNESYKDSLSSIRLTSYTPNRLTYETNNAQDGIAVFSEIYYPDGWHVTIDGQPAELARADYILRTMYVPAGQHTIEMRFDPTSLHVTEGIAYGALALLVIGIIVAVLIAKRKYVKA